MDKEKKAILEMLICATLWSIAGIFIKLIPWNGLAIAGARSFVAGITVFIGMKILGKKYTFNRNTFIAGCFAALTYCLFVFSNKLTTAANAIVLQFISPVFIEIYDVAFRGKPLRKADVITVSFTLAGIALFFFDQLEPGYVIGNLMSIAAGMSMAAMYISIGDLEPDERFSGALNGQIFTFFICLPFMIFTHPVFTTTAVVSVLILGVFQLGIAYLLYVCSTRYCPPLACCLLGALEPLLNPVWVFLFDGEHPGLFALIGAVIVVASVTLWCIFGKESPEKTA